LQKRKKLICLIFFHRFSSLEVENNAILGDLQKYLKTNRRELLWKPKEQAKEIERGIWNEKYLKKLYSTLKQFRMKKFAKRNLPKCFFYDDTPKEGPVKITHDDEQEKSYQNTLLVQKNIKGRAIQEMLQKGMKKFQNAIDEAKKTHSISAVQKLFPKEFSHQIDSQIQILSEYKRLEEMLKNDERLKEELKKVESKDAGNLLNFLEKELHRLEEEKRGHALYLLAERERYCREATNLAGSNAFEEQFQNDAITLYLENVLIQGINRALDDNSREYIRKVTRKIDRKAANRKVAFENSGDSDVESNTESISVEESPVEALDHKVVVELLKDQVFPQIADRVKNEQLKISQKKFLTHAHLDLYRDEIMQIQKEEEIKFCAEIIDEMITQATIPQIPDKFTEVRERQNSIEAEILASQLIEQILNEILLGGNIEVSTSTSDEDSTSRDYDGDNSNMQSVTETETESTTDILAKKVIQNVLSDIIEHGISSSTSTITESDSSDS
jgi:hypothetical protein